MRTSCSPSDSDVATSSPSGTESTPCGLPGSVSEFPEDDDAGKPSVLLKIIHMITRRVCALLHTFVENGQITVIGEEVMPLFASRLADHPEVGHVVQGLGHSGHG